MSFIVKGAEIPKTCLDCPLSDIEQGWCSSDMVTIIDFNELPVECPLVALPQSPTQDSCEYCHEDSDGYVKPIEKNSHAFVRFGMDGWELSLKANGWHGEARIKFCPMCGRRLADD